MKYKALLFDLDGTLLDTLDDLGEAVNAALGKRGFPLHNRPEYAAMVGHGVRNLVKTALPGAPDDALVDACLADFMAYYSDYIDVHTRPYPGIPELLAELDAAGVKLAVASNKFQSGAERLIREFFPGTDFVAILGNREGFPLKPDPAIVETVLRNAGVRRGETALVGDSPTDMKTAANAGIPGIAVSWGYRDMSAHPVVAETVSALRALLIED